MGQQNFLIVLFPRLLLPLQEEIHQFIFKIPKCVKKSDLIRMHLLLVVVSYHPICRCTYLVSFCPSSNPPRIFLGVEVGSDLKFGEEAELLCRCSLASSCPLLSLHLLISLTLILVLPLLLSKWSIHYSLNKLRV